MTEKATVPVRLFPSSHKALKILAAKTKARSLAEVVKTLLSK